VGPWTTAGSFTADRWNLALVGSTCSASIGAFGDAGRTSIGDEAAISFLGFNVTGTAGAGDYVEGYQRIEDVRRLAGKTITVSFWANVTVAGNKIGVSFTQAFGTGGSPSANVSGVGQAVSPPSASSTWARMTATFAIPSVAGKTFGTTANTDFTQIELWFSSGTTYSTRSGIGVQSGSFNIWGVQVEVASTATPLEYPNPQQDLARCQRQYQVIPQIFVSGYNAAGGLVFADYMYPVFMRALPAVVLSSPSYSNASAIAMNATYASHLRIQAAITAVGSGYAFANATLSAEL
jgi:hypothetical protein